MGAPPAENREQRTPILSVSHVTKSFGAVAVIYQEPTMFPDLTVAENVFMGCMPKQAAGRLDRDSMRRQVVSVLEMLDVRLDPNRAARGLSIADQQIVEIVASKNSIVAGPNAAAHSTAKAAELHLARCLAAEGGSASIRLNTVNPDAVLQGSRIWGSSWRKRAGRCVRHRSRGPGRALPQAHRARGQRAARGHRARGAAIRLIGAVRQEHRQPAERGRGRRRSVPAVRRPRAPDDLRGAWGLADPRGARILPT